MKKRFLGAIFSVALFFSVAQVFGVEAPDSFREFLLPNGMSVFVYEDFSTPIVRVEYSAKAGVAMQDADNAGYFPLYTELFANAGKYILDQNNAWLLEKLQCECNADSARYIIDATATELGPIFEQLSACAFAPVFSDAEVHKKFEASKNQVKQNAFSVEGFINGAIDSRVFAGAPWKHDSGIYPAIFENKTLSEVRAILKQISQKYYSPQNSALFISGAVHAQTVLKLAQETFGSYAPSAQNTNRISFKEFPVPDQRKFILSDNELSPDMAQIVVQYTSLTMEQADIAAIILNSPYSALKETLTKNAALNIIADEYINADAAHKNGSSRLIIQTLMEKAKANAFEQSAAFEEILQTKIMDFSEEEFYFAKQFLAEDFENAISDSENFMNLFSQYWAVEGFGKNITILDENSAKSQTLVKRFLSRPQNIMNQDYKKLKEVLQNERPWLFVLTNTKTFLPLKEKFAEADFQNITVKNGSWYTQELYKELQKPKSEDLSEQIEVSIYDKDFALQNKQSLQSAVLENGVRITIKNTPSSKKAAIALFINGIDIENYGMEYILASIIERNTLIRSYTKYQNKKLSKIMSSDLFVNETAAIIVFDCAAADTTAVLECIGEALLYSDIAPADVDMALSGRRAQQIMKTGSLATQLYAAGIRNFYKAPVYRTLYSIQKDILTKLKYTDVLEAYPTLLNANRLEIIASGNLDTDEFLNQCTRIFGNFNSMQYNSEYFVRPLDSKRNSLRIRLTHTFLTDVSAEKAGPRPAVLIPTTDFSDPVQYWIKSPASFETESAVFDALLLELEAICQKNIHAEERFSKMTVRIEEKSALVSFGAITFFNVKNVSDADALLKQSLLELKENLGALDAIKSRWIKQRYKNSAENTAAVKIIAEKINISRLGGTPFVAQDAFTKDYETVCFATEEDFLEVFEKYFAEEAFKIYSADSKK